MLLFLVPLEDAFPCEESDVATIAAALHFGTKPLWIYNTNLPDWPHLEPRPVYGPLGLIPVASA